jgi:hypothetical protein
MLIIFDVSHGNMGRMQAKIKLQSLKNAKGCPVEDVSSRNLTKNGGPVSY